MTVKVSVVTPTYNSEAFIADAIKSVMRQTYDNWELIVVDDGSIDSTREIVDELGHGDRRIRYVAQKHNGQGKARNEGIARSTGSLVAFLDSDDLWEPEKLDLQVSALEDAGVDLVFSSGFLLQDGEGGSATIPFDAVIGAVVGRFPGPVMLRRLLLGNCIVSICSVLVRANTLRAIGAFSEAPDLPCCEDYDLYLRLAESGATFLGLPDKLVFYRKHPASSSANRERMLRAEAVVLETHLADKSLDSELRRRICDTYYHLVRSLVSVERFDEARECFSRISHYDPWRISVWIRRFFLAIAPRKFNRMSDHLSITGDVLRHLPLGRSARRGATV